MEYQQGYSTASSVTGEVSNNVHSDPRIRSLQMQTREMAMRQGIERLRLVNAKERKRVVICSTVPVPGLPVSELVSWADIVPSRLQAAIAEAAQNGGVLRFSASGLCSDAQAVAKRALGPLSMFDVEETRTGEVVAPPRHRPRATVMGWYSPQTPPPRAHIPRPIDMRPEVVAGVRSG